MRDDEWLPFKPPTNRQRLWWRIRYDTSQFLLDVFWAGMVVLAVVAFGLIVLMWVLVELRPFEWW